MHSDKSTTMIIVLVNLYSEHNKYNCFCVKLKEEWISLVYFCWHGWPVNTKMLIRVFGFNWNVCLISNDDFMSLHWKKCNDIKYRAKYVDIRFCYVEYHADLIIIHF